MIRAALLALALVASSASAQSLIEIGGYCSFDEQGFDAQIYGFDADDDAERAVAEIVRHTGLAPNFTIRAANVPNAAAVIDGSTGERLILYSQEFMRSVRERTSSNWSEVSILAHELGHHLQGHTLLEGGSRPPIELEADRFSGFVLYRMGATLDDALRAMRTIASEEGSSTHPPRSARVAAITNGYIESEALASGQPPPPRQPEGNPDTPAPTPPPIPEGADVPDETDYEGQVRYQLESIHQRLSRSGYTRVLDGHIAQIDADGTERFTLDLSAGQEYQIVGVCDNDCTDIDLRLFDPSGAKVDEDVLEDDVPVVSITPDQDGQYAIDGIMYECQTEFCFIGLSVWVRGGGGTDQFGRSTGPGNDFEEQVAGYLRQASAEYVEGQQVGGTQFGVVESNGTVRFTFEASAAATLVGVCDSDCSDVDLRLFNASGELIDEDVLVDDVPIVSVPGAGQYTAEVVMPGCSTSICYYAAGLYRGQGGSGNDFGINARGGSDQFGSAEGPSNEYEETVAGYLQDVTNEYANNGTQKIGGTQFGTSMTESPTRFTFEVSAASTVVGVCDNDCSDMDIKLYNAAGELVDEDVLVDDVPIVEVPGAGRYTAEVLMPGCSTAICYYAAGLYRK